MLHRTGLPPILHICQLVDGNALGIELAAAWIHTLSCDEIAQQIEHGLDFLSVTTRDLPPRHRSMRAVFNQSWKLLPEEEKQLLARLSVFRGGFRHQAAEQIAGATSRCYLRSLRNRWCGAVARIGTICTNSCDNSPPNISRKITMNKSRPDRHSKYLPDILR